MGTRLYVGNLAYSTTEEGLRNAFGADGRTVTNVFLVMDRETGRPRGFAFVELANEEDAKAAIAAMDGFSLDGRQLRVNEAQERSGGGGGGPRRFGGGGDRGPPRVERGGGFGGDRPGGGGDRGGFGGGDRGGGDRGGFGGGDRGGGDRGGFGGGRPSGGGFNDRGPPRGPGGGGGFNDRGPPRGGGFGDRGGGFGDRGGFRSAPPIPEAPPPEVDRGARREQDRQRDRKKYDRDDD